MAGANQKGRTKKQTAGKPAAEDRGVWREVLGILMFFAGVILIYLLATEPKDGIGADAVWLCRALAGGLSYIMGILFCWMGIVVAFSGRQGSTSPRRVFLVMVLGVLVMTLYHLFSAADIMYGAKLYDYTTFLERSRDYQKGGAGLIGAFLCWPLYRNLTAAGAAITLVALILVNLILQRKISLRKIGARAQERFDDFKEQQQARATRRMEEREARRESAAVIPKVAPRQTKDDMDDPFVKYLGDEAPSRKRKREQRIEKISSEPPLPGEPKVTPKPADDLIDDIPDFLSGRRNKRVKAEKINIAEPKPLTKAMDEALYPMPDGSEVAEIPPYESQSQINGNTKESPREGDGIVHHAMRFDATDADIDRFMSGGDIVSLINEQTKDILPEPKPELDDDADESIADELNADDPLNAEGGISASHIEPKPAPKHAIPPIAKPAPPIAKPSSSFDRAPFDVLGDKPQSRIPPIASPAPPIDEQEYVYPPVDLLDASKPSKIQNQSEHDLEKGKKLIETLASFNISARMLGVAHGPTVTRFELSPAPGVKVSRITALADDIALNLAAISVRIEAPIPGKSAVGVEVPNDVIEIVPLRDVLESAECRKATSRLAVALGRDNAGKYVIADLAKMPHVLIAGQTGSGKSVCINCIICSILYRSTPDEVKLIMIDPKVVELSCYNGIPHLLVPVVSDPKKASGALQWAVKEMTDRYDRFANLGVRDIKSFNAHRPADVPAMPQIVIIIDELADLMMVVPGEVEDSICRLAQLARAAGIHLVIATQRPSVNVITGVIKANIPSRIAFTVTSQVDSRTILDGSGAEKLLGRGDMLYAPSGMAKTRVQGAWVSDDEVHAVVDFIKVRSAPSYDEDMIENIDMAGRSDADKKELLDEFDELLPEAVEIVVQAEQASVSMLQRRLRVGHSRAGRLIDEMEVRGIVGPDEGSKSRKVLITREQFKTMFKE